MLIPHWSLDYFDWLNLYKYFESLFFASMFLPIIFLIYVIFATAGFHVLFAAKRFFGKMPRFDLLEISDYVWYSSGALFVALTLNGIQKEQIALEYKALKSRAYINFNLAKSSIDRLNEACLNIMKADDRDPETVQFGKFICREHFEDGKFHGMFYLDSTCNASGRWFDDSNDQTFGAAENRDQQTTEALNLLDAVCFWSTKAAEIDKSILDSRHYVQTTEGTVDLSLFLKLHFFFAIPIGLKLTKTTSSIVASRRNKIRNS